MNSINEKEKKLNTALDELKNLDLSNPNLRNNIENLNFQHYSVDQDYRGLNFLVYLMRYLIFFLFR